MYIYCTLNFFYKFFPLFCWRESEGFPSSNLRLKVILPILRAVKLPIRQIVPTVLALIFLGLTYYAGFLIGESSSMSGNFIDEWGVSVTSDGFLEVSKILKDPRTTSDPMVGWFANKLQVWKKLLFLSFTLKFNSINFV